MGWKAEIGDRVKILKVPSNLHTDHIGHQGRVTRIQKQRTSNGLPGNKGWLYSVYCYSCGKHLAGLKAQAIMKVIKRIELPPRPYGSMQTPMDPSWYNRDERLRRGLE